MNRALPIVVLTCFLAGAAAAYVALAPPPAAPTGVTTGKALIGGPFNLTTHTGKQVNDKDFAGKPMLVFFGFTNCPDICPSGLQIITAALDKLGTKSEELSPLFITIDPDRDTPEKLAAYMQSFHPRITALSGTVDNIAAVKKAYRVYAEKVADEKTPGAYSIDHSTFFYLMDKSGEYVKHFPHSIDAEKLAAELQKAL
jgi:protein SCO1